MSEHPDKKPSRVASLLATLQQKPLSKPEAEAPAAPVAKAAAPTKTPKSEPKEAKPASATRPVAREAAPKKPKRGKPIQIYLHEQDVALIRELSAWFAAQNRRINDSLVIKSALRAVKQGSDLLHAYDAAVKMDARRKEE